MNNRAFLITSMFVCSLSVAHAKPIATVDGNPIEPNWAKTDWPTKGKELERFARRATEAAEVELLRLVAVDLKLDFNAVDDCASTIRRLFWTEPPPKTSELEHTPDFAHGILAKQLADVLQEREPSTGAPWKPSTSPTYPFKAYTRSIDISVPGNWRDGRIDVIEKQLTEWMSKQRNGIAPDVSSLLKRAAQGLPCTGDALNIQVTPSCRTAPPVLGTFVVTRKENHVAVEQIVATCDSSRCTAMKGAETGILREDPWAETDQFRIGESSVHAIMKAGVRLEASRADNASRVALAKDIAFLVGGASPAWENLRNQLYALPPDTPMVCLDSWCALRKDFRLKPSAGLAMIPDDTLGGLSDTAALAVFARQNGFSPSCVAKSITTEMSPTECTRAERKQFLKAMRAIDSRIRHWAEKELIRRGSGSIPRDAEVNSLVKQERALEYDNFVSKEAWALKERLTSPIPELQFALGQLNKISR